MARTPCGFLDGSLRALVLEDDGCQAQLTLDMLRMSPLYECRCARRAGEAERVLREDGPFHVCTYDLGIVDLDGDEFALMRRHRGGPAFVVVSGNSTREACFRAREMGALDLMDKPCLGSADFLRRINHASLRALLGAPVPDSGGNVVAMRVVETIIRHLPVSVAKLRALMHVSRAYLKAICADALPGPPSLLISAARLYCAAFASEGNLPQQVEVKPPTLEQALDELQHEVRGGGAAVTALLSRKYSPGQGTAP